MPPEAPPAPNPNPAPPAPTPNEPPAPTPPAPPSAPTEPVTGPNDGQEAKFTQADLERIVGERLERERRKTEAATAKAQEEAEAARLKEQGLWQKAAEQAETKVKELSPQLEAATAEVTRWREIVTAQIDSEIKTWPAEVLALIPAADTDPLARYDAVNRTRPLAAKLAGTPPPPGNGPNPRPVGGPSNAEGNSRVASFMRGRV